MNCIWVLRKAKGHNFEKMLVDDIIQSEKNTCSFATIALENHWSPWFKKEQIEKLGFKSIDEIKVAHKTKHTKQTFSIHLIWIPMKEESEKPFWNKQKLLHGEYFCCAHPLYNPQFWKGNIIEVR